METLEFIIFGGETRRYHTWPVLHNQRVDSHAYNVAMICSLLARDKGVSAALLLSALTHDLAEWKMGDLPAPAKRAMPPVEIAGRGKVPFREVWGEAEEIMLINAGLSYSHMLNAQEQRWLKLADAMEGCLYCIRERMMGNRYIDTCYNNYHKYVSELLLPEEERMVVEIWMYINDAWEQAQ